VPNYQYKALRADGSTATGAIQASDEKTARRLLTRRKLQVFDLGATAVTGAAPTGRRAKRQAEEIDAATTDRTKVLRLKRGEVVQFTEELSDLVGAGMQLEPALLVMEKRGEKSSIKVVATRIREKVRDGMAFSSALKSSSASFDDLYCNLAAAGEAGGSLPSILRRHAEYLRTMSDLRGKFLFAMIYPSFLVAAGIGVTILFIAFLVPNLAKLIDRSGEAAPFLISILLTVSDLMNEWWWLILALLAVAVMAIIVSMRTPAARRWWDGFSLKIPLFGGIISGRFYVQFLQTLSNLMGDGLPFLKALHLASGTTSNTHMRDRLKMMEEEVGDGRQLTSSMRRTGLFPERLTDMVAIGEQTGNISESLGTTAKRYDRELTNKIEGLGAAIQPIIIIAMAVVVGVMAYFMISVIYDTINTLRSR